MKIPVIAGLALMLMAAPVQAGDTPSPDGAAVYFINLKDGDTVSSPVLIQFGLKGMGVQPAGVEGKPNTGHHHLIIDAVIEGEDLDYSIPADDNHRHFGGGQTEALIELAPGTHVLQMVLGDMNHIPHNPPVMSERITITVE